MPEGSGSLEGKARDVAEFLDEVGFREPLRSLPARVCYDDPCHLVHAQGGGTLSMYSGLLTTATVHTCARSRPGSWFHMHMGRGVYAHARAYARRPHPGRRHRGHRHPPSLPPRRSSDPCAAHRGRLPPPTSHGRPAALSDERSGEDTQHRLLRSHVRWGRIKYCCCPQLAHPRNQSPAASMGHPMRCSPWWSAASNLTWPTCSAFRQTERRGRSAPPLTGYVRWDRIKSCIKYSCCPSVSPPDPPGTL